MPVSLASVLQYYEVFSTKRLFTVLRDIQYYEVIYYEIFSTTSLFTTRYSVLRGYLLRDIQYYEVIYYEIFSTTRLFTNFN